MKFIYTIAIFVLTFTSCTESSTPITDSALVANSVDSNDLQDLQDSNNARETQEPKICNNIESFIAEGWKTLKTEKGDLNKDGIPDVALVVQEDDPSNIVEDHGETKNKNPRELIVLFGTSEENCYELNMRSKTFIPADIEISMEDPFDEIYINKGTLRINFHEFYTIGSWISGQYSYIWRFQNGRFELIGADSDKFHRADGDGVEVSANFSTKKYSVKTYNMFDSEFEEKVEWKEMDLDELKTFETFKSPWTWKLNSDILL